VSERKAQIITTKGLGGFMLIPKSYENEFKQHWNDPQKVGYYNDVYFDSFNHSAQRNEFFKILYGGSGSGKSENKAMEMLYDCASESYFRCLYCRKFGATVRTSQFQLFKDIITRHNWYRFFKVNETSMTITHIETGNFLMGMGIDDVHKATSLPAFTHIWIEEPLSKTKKKAEDVSEKELSELIRRLRPTSEYSVQIHLTFNPISKESWIYKLFFDVNNPKYEEFGGNCFALKSIYSDNQFIDTEAYGKQLRMNNSYDYAIFANGDWGSPRADNPAFWNFDYDKHVRRCKDFDYSLPIVLSFDQNIGIMATIAIQYSKEKKFIRVRKEFSRSKDNVELLKKIKTEPFYNEKKYLIEFTGDASGKNKHHMLESNFYSYLIKETGIDESKNKVRRSNLEHIDSLNNCNRAFLEYDVQVDEDCVELINDLQSTETTSESKIDKKAHDPHYGDDLRYFIDTYIYNNVVLEQIY
jgi:phage terminase large subunit